MVKDFFICAKEIANNGEPKCFDCLCTLDVITKGLGGPIPCCNGDCLCKYETYILGTSPFGVVNIYISSLMILLMVH